MEKDVYEKYESLYVNYIETLNDTIFSMLALDYDGTLCGSDITSRYKDSLDPKLLKHILTILNNNVKIAIITGRGKSIISVLKHSIPTTFNAV